MTGGLVRQSAGTVLSRHHGAERVRIRQIPGNLVLIEDPLDGIFE